MIRILFVCTGNTCRSPMAEAMFRRMASEAGITAEARSAGVAAADGYPISSNSRAVLMRKGISDELKSKMLGEEDIRWADLILTMTMNHKRLIIEHFPEAVHKVFTLKEFSISDTQLQGIVEERESLIAHLQLNMALNQPIDNRDRERLMELEAQIPNYDITDPFGGDMKMYTACAEEIEQELRRLIAKLRERHAADDSDPEHPASS